MSTTTLAKEYKEKIAPELTKEFALWYIISASLTS